MSFNYCDAFVTAGISEGYGIEILNFDHTASTVDIVAYRSTSAPALALALDCQDDVNAGPYRIFGEVNFDGTASSAAAGDFNYVTQEETSGTFGSTPISVTAADCTAESLDIDYVVHTVSTANFEDPTVSALVGSNLVSTYTWTCEMNMQDFDEDDFVTECDATTWDDCHTDLPGISSLISSYARQFTVTVDTVVDAVSITDVVVNANEDGSLENVDVLISDVVSITITGADGGSIPAMSEGTAIELQFNLGDADAGDGIDAVAGYEISQINDLTFDIDGTPFAVITNNNYNDDKTNFVRFGASITKDGDDYQTFFMLAASIFGDAGTVDISGAVTVDEKTSRRRNVDQNGVNMDADVTFSATGILLPKTPEQASASQVVVKSFALIAGAMGAMATMC